MGAGRGQNRRAQATVSRGSIKLREFKEPVVFKKGRQGEKCLHCARDNVHYYVSERHPEPDELVRRFMENLTLCPARLQQPLRFVGFPHDTFNGVEPGAPGTVPMSAAQNQGLVAVWGTQHIENGYRNLGRQLLEHELSHLACNGDGVPEGMAESWKDARIGDAVHQLSLPELTPFRAKVQIGDTARTLLHGRVSLTPYSDESPNEDWAEAVEFHLLDQRQGWLWRGDDETVRFAEYYPNRARLVTEFLRS